MTKPMAPPEQRPSEEAAFRAAIAEGIAQADAGLGTPLDDVAEWLATWGEAEEAPPPR